MATCKGIKKDGTPCESPIVLDNGYCRAHQDQAPEATASQEPVRWTRGRLEAAIAAHGGPEGLDLSGADLANLDLSHMDLHGTILSRWDVRSMTLIVANLQGVNLSFAKLHEAILTGVTPQGAILRGANLERANLEIADLREANLAGADLQGAYLRDANLQGANLQAADLRDVDLLGVRKGGLLGIKLYRAKLDRTVLKREQLGPAIGEEQAEEYRKARDAYLALKQNFESLGDYEAASWSYIKERQMEKACSAPWRARRFYGREQLGDTISHKFPTYHPRVCWFFARHMFKWVVDGAVYVVCGYGERPWWTLGWMAVLLFGSPVLLGLLGLLHWPKANYDAFFSRPVPWRYGYAYLQQFLYVLDAFTTANLAELQPANSLGRLCSGLIALVGIFLTGLLGFVAGNRIRRS